MTCEIYLHSTSEHISQLCTGFSLLESQNKIQLSYKFGPFGKFGKRPFAELKPYDLQGLFVVLDGQVIFYDVTDGPTLLMEALEVTDIYFKRSYSKEAIPHCYREVVFPLGLNYEVYSGRFDMLDLSRFALNGKSYQSPRQLVKSIFRNTGLTFSPTIKEMSAPPIVDKSPKVLFMARTWNPDYYPGGFPADTPEHWKEVCTTINETRYKIICALKKELGSMFYGGFAAESYAIQKYPKGILNDPNSSGKRSYLQRLKEFPICIASTGLYHSAGWKLGEYVAFSKSIISEKLNCVLPGNFSKGQNYLEFETVDECLNRTVELIENKDKREQMMKNNHLYYETYLSPDQLIWQTLSKVTDGVYKSDRHVLV